jgi:hypothetical protein
MDGLKAIRINNVHWMAHLAEPIIKLAEILKHPTITSQSLHMHLANIASISQQTDNVELWGVFDEDYKCIAFADWCVKSSPYIGTVYMEFIYSWNRKREPVMLLLDEWRKYGERKFTKPYYMADLINESVMKVFDKIVADLGYEYKRTGIINTIGKKKDG